MNQMGQQLREDAYRLLAVVELDPGLKAECCDYGN